MRWFTVAAVVRKFWEHVIFGFRACFDSCGRFGIAGTMYWMNVRGLASLISLAFWISASLAKCFEYGPRHWRAHNVL